LLAFVIACSSGDDDDDAGGASTGGGADPTPAQATGSTAGGSTGSTGGQSTGSGGSTGSQATGATGATGAASTGASDDSEEFDPEDCPELQALAESAGLSEDAFTTGGLGDDFDAENFRRLADNSPDEIRDDMQLLAGVLEEFFGKLEELELDFSNPASFASLTPEELAELEELTAGFDTPEITAASERIEAYFAEVCS
jgi:hypothetical protein